jgi:hypothetical protein
LKNFQDPFIKIAASLKIKNYFPYKTKLYD